MSKRKVQVKESELLEHFKVCLFEEELMNEGLTPAEKDEVKTLVRNEIRDFLKMSRSESFETAVKNMVKDYVKKDKDLEKHYVEISKNVLIQLYKTLYTRRSFWASELKNASN